MIVAACLCGHANVNVYVHFWDLSNQFLFILSAEFNSNFKCCFVLINSKFWIRKKKIKMAFTNHEMNDMHFCYGLADGSSSEALRLYRERFPNRKIPNRRIFKWIHRCLVENGRFLPVPDRLAWCVRDY